MAAAEIFTEARGLPKEETIDYDYKKYLVDQKRKQMRRQAHVISNETPKTHRILGFVMAGASVFGIMWGAYQAAENKPDTKPEAHISSNVQNAQKEQLKKIAAVPTDLPKEGVKNDK